MNNSTKDFLLFQFSCLSTEDLRNDNKNVNVTLFSKSKKKDFLQARQEILKRGNTGGAHVHERLSLCQCSSDKGPISN